MAMKKEQTKKTPEKHPHLVFKNLIFVEHLWVFFCECSRNRGEDGSEGDD